MADLQELFSRTLKSSSRMTHSIFPPWVCFEKQCLIWKAAAWKPLLACCLTPFPGCRLSRAHGSGYISLPCCFSALTVNKVKCLFPGQFPKCACCPFLSSLPRNIGALPSRRRSTETSKSNRAMSWLSKMILHMRIQMLRSLLRIPSPAISAKQLVYNIANH